MHVSTNALNGKHHGYCSSHYDALVSQMQEKQLARKIKINKLGHNDRVSLSPRICQYYPQEI